jgi:hypothetical protein
MAQQRIHAAGATSRRTSQYADEELARDAWTRPLTMPVPFFVRGAPARTLAAA